MTPTWLLPLLRYAFLAGLLALVVQAVRAVFASLDAAPAPPLARSDKEPSRSPGGVQ
jgi:hypothetical protein